MSKKCLDDGQAGLGQYSRTQALVGSDRAPITAHWRFGV